jgi:hypothetical protein
MTFEQGKCYFVVISSYLLEKCFQRDEDLKMMKRRLSLIKGEERNENMAKNMRWEHEILAKQVEEGTNDRSAAISF